MKKLITAAAIALLLAGHAAGSSIEIAHSAAAPLSLAVDGQAVLHGTPPSFQAAHYTYLPARCWNTTR